MASTISVTFKLNADGKSFKDLAKDATGLKTAVTSSVEACSRLQHQVSRFNFERFSKSVASVNAAVQTFSRTVSSLSASYALQETAEAQLSAVMRERMGATDAEVESIKQLTQAQQKLGVVGDEVQLSGAQQLATFLSEKRSLDVLIPAMNDLIAQQDGLNATQQSAQSIGNMLGKAMQGQVSTLQRVGITFSAAQAEVLKYGTESERAAMLAEVIRDNVGDMNATLAATDSGKQKQLANSFGDIKERLGSLVTGTQPFFAIASSVAMCAAEVPKLTKGFQALNLTFLASPIGATIAAVAALAAAVVLAYNHSATFRAGCDALWSSLKSLWQSLVEGITPSFQALLGQFKAAVRAVSPLCAIIRDTLGSALLWVGKTVVGLVVERLQAMAKTLTWLSGIISKTLNHLNKLLGLEPRKSKAPKAAVQAEPEPAKSSSTPAPIQPAATTSTPAVKDNTPIYRAEAATLSEIQENVRYYQQQLQAASLEEAASINASIALWEGKAEAIRHAGEEQATSVSATVVPSFNAEAVCLADITTNIQILRDALQTASLEEAAQINASIALWEAKADAIRKAGTATEDYAVEVQEASSLDNALSAWGDVKQVASGISGLSAALDDNRSAWDRVCSAVDGVFSLISGFSSLLGAVSGLFNQTGTSATATATAEGTAATASGVLSSALATQIAIVPATIAANKALTASYMELASSIFFAAHAYIPFAGAGIASGFISEAVATVLAVAATPFAKGGVVSGPTLAYVGEYAGASSNPEVIAPLDKLRGMLGGGGKVDFRVRGKQLVGVLANQTRYGSRSGHRTNIEI